VCDACAVGNQPRSDFSRAVPASAAPTAPLQLLVSDLAGSVHVERRMNEQTYVRAKVEALTRDK
jgi:hypothetical protein